LQLRLLSLLSFRSAAEESAVAVAVAVAVAFAFVVAVALLLSSFAPGGGPAVAIVFAAAVCISDCHPRRGSAFVPLKTSTAELDKPPRLQGAKLRKQD
jgi:hypothetical protein